MSDPTDHNREAEECFVACCIERPEWLSKASEPMFHCGDTKLVFKQILAYTQAHRQASEIDIQMHLATRHRIVLAKVMDWRDKLSTPELAPYYLGIIHDLWRERKIKEVHRKRFNNEIDDNEFAQLIKKVPAPFDAPQGESNAEIVRRVYDKLEAAAEGKQLYVPSGFKEFDMKTGGLTPGTMTILAARPSVGKTALGLTIANHVSILNGIKSVFFSSEMPTDSLASRLLALNGEINMLHVARRGPNENETKKLAVWGPKIANAPIELIEKTSWQEINTHLRISVERGAKLAVIDYLQRLNWIGEKVSKTERVGKIAVAIKTAALEYNIPIIVLAQVNREVDKDNRAPRLSDLRDSGEIEQEADIVGFLHPREARIKGQPQPVDLNIEKARAGEVGQIQLKYRAEYTKYELANSFDA